MTELLHKKHNEWLQKLRDLQTNPGDYGGLLPTDNAIGRTEHFLRAFTMAGLDVDRVNPCDGGSFIYLKHDRRFADVTIDGDCDTVGALGHFDRKSEFKVFPIAVDDVVLAVMKIENWLLCGR